MDPCVFTLYHPHHEDPEAQLCDMLCLHIDDMLGAGDKSCFTYIEAEQKLQKSFNFRTWDDDPKEITYSRTILNRKNYAWTLGQEGYIHKVEAH